ncbi:MAG TPA: nuclear transport factor 2 family protein [Thermoanaerobaculia bacterium]
MSAQNRRAIVEKAYADFGQGDIPSIISALSPDVEWREPGAPYVPYGGTYRGHEGVGQFFSKLDGSLEMLEFEPRDLIEQGDKVVALGHFKARSRPNGNVFETDWTMVWNFSGDKIARFQSFVDTAAVAEAYRAG